MENQHRKIVGYRDLTQAEIDLMNRIKDVGEELLILVEDVRSAIAERDRSAETIATNADRWASIGATDLQTGLMALTRAVARPTTF